MSINAQLTLSVQLPDDETFDSFKGEVNAQVAKLLKQFIHEPVTGGQVNACYIFGLSGVGKSHLLHASCAFAQQQELSSLCLSFNELKHLSVEVLEGLEQIDVICLDDIENIADQADWQQAVFDLYNRVIEHNKKLIITGNKSVADLDITLPDLRSRLAWGYVEQLKPLPDEEKLNAIRFRAQQRGLMLSDEVLKFLISRTVRDMKSLLSSLDKLDRASIQKQRKITIPFVKQILMLQ